MNLYILRHASAGTSRPNPLLDAKRPLDKEGKEHCLHLAYVLNALKVSFDTIVSSPLKRSLQTAQLIATETGFEPRVILSSGLSPQAGLEDFMKLLRQYSDCENVLMVGHSPNIQNFLGSLLIPSTPGAKPAMIRLRKGAIARVSISRGPAVLSSLLDPRTVRALYKSSKTQATSTRSSRRKTSRK